MSIHSGIEPRLGGERAMLISTGYEPMLGGEHYRKLVIRHMLTILHDEQTTHLRRATIGDLLDELGDPRPGVGLNEQGLPNIDWCAVPGGEVFIPGQDTLFHVEPFFIARYPVTWKQYRAFLEALDGHLELDWWSGLQRRDEYPREAFLRDNLPAQEVSWYDAVAFTRWLSEKLGYQVRLPTECEWEQAATGGSAEHVYPWGWQIGSNFANTRESRLRRATAVGMYPAGASPVGAMDMSGNVLEWCLNEFDRPDRSDPSPARRSMRGGSWFQILSRAHTFFRASDNPYYRFNAAGFRLAADDLTPVERDADEPEEDQAGEPVNDRGGEELAPGEDGEQAHENGSQAHEGVLLSGEEEAD